MTKFKRIFLLTIFITIVVISFCTFLYGCINKRFDFISVSFMMITPTIIGLILLNKSRY